MSKKIASTPLSNFVQNMSSSEEKKVYDKVIIYASESNNSTTDKAKAIA